MKSSTVSNIQRGDSQGRMPVSPDKVVSLDEGVLNQKPLFPVEVTKPFQNIPLIESTNKPTTIDHRSLRLQAIAEVGKLYPTDDDPTPSKNRKFIPPTVVNAIAQWPLEEAADLARFHGLHSIADMLLAGTKPNQNPL